MNAKYSALINWVYLFHVGTPGRCSQYLPEGLWDVRCWDSPAADQLTDVYLIAKQ